MRQGPRKAEGGLTMLTGGPNKVEMGPQNVGEGLIKLKGPHKVELGGVPQS